MPAVQKFSKEGRLAAYDALAEKMVKEDEKNNLKKDDSFKLSNEEIKFIEDGVSKIATDTKNNEYVSNEDMNKGMRM